MTKRTLYVSDLDGTLLDNEARLSDKSRELLNLAISRGANFTVATARTPATVVPILEGVDMKLPAIVMTGAAWWDFEKGGYTRLKFHSPDDVRTITAAFDSCGVTPFVYALPDDDILNVYYSGTPDVVDAKFIDARMGLRLKCLRVGYALPPALANRVLLFFASGRKEVLEQVSDTIRQRTRCAVSSYDDIYNPGTALIEIFAPEVSKAAAITEMRSEYGFDSVTVFGDNLNDIPMFDVADTSVAVAGAVAEARAVADIVIGANTDDAVPRYIEEMHN